MSLTIWRRRVLYVAIRVRVLPRGLTLEVEAPSGRLRVSELLKRVNVSPSMAVVFRDGKMLTESDYVNDGESVDVVLVVSGG